MITVTPSSLNRWVDRAFLSLGSGGRVRYSPSHRHRQSKGKRNAEWPVHLEKAVCTALEGSQSQLGADVLQYFVVASNEREDELNTR